MLFTVNLPSDILVLPLTASLSVECSSISVAIPKLSVILALPTTSNFACGLFFPIPTLLSSVVARTTLLLLVTVNLPSIISVLPLTASLAVESNELPILTFPSAIARKALLATFNSPGTIGSKSSRDKLPLSITKPPVITSPVLSKQLDRDGKVSRKSRTLN